MKHDLRGNQDDSEPVTAPEQGSPFMTQSSGCKDADNWKSNALLGAEATGHETTTSNVGKDVLNSGREQNYLKTFVSEVLHMMIMMTCFQVTSVV